MKLRHFSGTPVEKVVSKKQAQSGIKPTGLWVSDEDDHGWFKWCKGERFRLEDLAYEYDVTLSDKANILYISNSSQLQAFQDRYIDTRPESVNYMLRHSPRPGEYSPFVHELRWDLVAQDYDGIIITPYLWDERLGHKMWYYGWDCASGCIWNAKAVKKIELVRCRPSYVKYGLAERKRMEKIMKSLAKRPPLSYAKATKTRGA